jgi:hypothetical protein
MASFANSPKRIFSYHRLRAPRSAALALAIRCNHVGKDRNVVTVQVCGSDVTPWVTPRARVRLLSLKTVI